jgi:adenylate cyclase
MAIEIERKFLVTDRDWGSLAPGVTIRQGYLPSRDDTVTRVRIVGDKGFLTLKGPDRGAGRPEFEFSIPPQQARQILLELCEKPIIEKTRHRIDYGNRTWEIDVFHSDNEGLVVAEIELTSKDEKVDLPPWVRKEVTDDQRYYNVNLVKAPYRSWGERRRS